MIIDGKYIRINVAVTINNVIVVRMFDRRSCRCCRSMICWASFSKADERRVDVIEFRDEKFDIRVLDPR